MTAGSQLRAEASGGGGAAPRALRLAVVTTHPIQYFTPLYRELAARPDVDLRVYFAHRPTPEEQGQGFGVPFTWDIDLTSGYPHAWLRNRAPRPDTTRFAGCDTPEIADIIAREHFDAVLVTGWNVRTFWQAMRACWRTGTPVLVRGDSQLDARAPRLRRAAKRLLYPLFMRRFAGCLAVGERSEEYFRHYGARRVVRSPHFVDNERFGSAARELAAERVALRDAWGVPREAAVALFAGKFIWQKAPLDLVRAAARARSAGASRLHLLFVGEGALRPETEAECRRLDVPATFVGFLNQSAMPRAYAAADFLVLPSRSETWGLVVNEAMASGLPVVISSAVGSAPDLVRAGVTGLVHDRDDLDALAGALGELARAPERCAAMGAAARAHVARYSVRAAADGIVEAARTAAGVRLA